MWLIKSHCRQPIRAHKTYDIRFCFGVQIQTLRTIVLFHTLHADRPAIYRGRRPRKINHTEPRDTEQPKWQDKCAGILFCNQLSSLNNSLTTLAFHYILHIALCIMLVLDTVMNTSFCWSVVSSFPCHYLLCLFCPSNCYTLDVNDDHEVSWNLTNELHRWFVYNSEGLSRAMAYPEKYAVVNK